MPGQKGNKGGGRRSAYQELQDAKRLWALWTKPGIKHEIEERLASGDETLEDIFISLGYEGKENVLINIFKKLFPDYIDVKSGGKTLQGVGVLLPPIKEDDK